MTTFMRRRELWGHLGWMSMLACLLVGCTRSKSDETPAKASSVSSPHEGSKRIRLSAEVFADAKIKTAPVTKEVLFGTLDLPGEIAADPDRTARIASPVAGRIEQVTFKEGTPVKKGDALAVIRVPELGKIRSAYASTTVKAKTARTSADRFKRLRAEGLAAEQESLDAEAQAQALEADARALGEQLGAMGMNSGGTGALLTLRASLSGVAVSRDAVAGQPINPDQSIGTIADLSEVWFLCRVFERNLDLLRVGATARVKLDAFPKESFEGKVSYIGKQIDPTTRTLTGRIQITNPKDTLRIGLYGTAHVLSDEDAAKPPAIVVPSKAVLDLAGKSVAFVMVRSGEFEVHEVVLGNSVLDRVEVKAGLSEGQEVVVEGGFTLKSAVLKGTFAEEK